MGILHVGSLVTGVEIAEFEDATIDVFTFGVGVGKRQSSMTLDLPIKRNGHLINKTLQNLRAK